MIGAEKRATDEQIEVAAEKLIAGKPLTRAEQRLLDSPQSDFAMGQVRAILAATAPAPSAPPRGRPSQET